jgi:hypothetical protein
MELHGYIDSDWTKRVVDRNKTLKSCLILGSTVITWFSRKQNTIALSSKEEKHISVRITSYEAIWLRKLLTGLFDQKLETTVIYYDKKSCIKSMRI